MIKPFLAFKDYNAWKDADRKWQTYEFDHKENWYLEPDRNGFSLETVEKCPHLFILADTMDELSLLMRQDDHQRAYGEGATGDFACPKCGFLYKASPYSEFENGLNENWKTKISCICGQKFVASIKEVNIVYQTQEMK